LTTRHSHGGLAGDSQSLDVGVDCWDFRPVTLREIKERLATMPSASNSITIDRQSEPMTIRRDPAPTISVDIRRDIGGGAVTDLAAGRHMLLPGAHRAICPQRAAQAAGSFEAFDRDRLLCRSSSPFVEAARVAHQRSILGAFACLGLAQTHRLVRAPA
jgi:hypothetical protein